jgi:uncharacterized protein (TIGR01777 family)
MANILITGGRGGIGSRLRDYFTSHGHQVRILTRSVSKLEKHEYHWNPSNGEIDLNAFHNLDGIVHLAGEPVLGKRWTTSQKQLLRNSRIEGIACLTKALQQTHNPLKFFAGASAVGFYGLTPITGIANEHNPPGNDFLSHLCVEWENAYTPLKAYCERLIIFRIGIVLDAHAGMLKALWPLYRFGLGVCISNGKAVYPWIHHMDLCKAMHWIITTGDGSGIYNLTAPTIDTQLNFHNALQQLSKIPNISPAIPEWVFTWLLGESAQMVTQGNAVAPKGLLDSGFVFEYTDLKIALRTLLNRI